MNQITPKALKEKIDSKETFFILDVRDPFEKYQSNIKVGYYQNIPADRLEAHLDELEARKEDEIICLCRAGSRCVDTLKLLTQNGYTNVKALQGGINKWAKEIDNSLPMY